MMVVCTKALSLSCRHSLLEPLLIQFGMSIQAAASATNQHLCSQRQDLHCLSLCAGQQPAAMQIFSTQGECLATCAHLQQETRGEMTGLAFSSDSTMLVSAASDGTVAAWALDLSSKAASTGIKKGFM